MVFVHNAKVIVSKEVSWNNEHVCWWVAPKPINFLW